MAWIILFVASAFEVAWVVGMRYTEFFTRLWPTVFTLVTSLCSFGLLALAMRTLPIGTSYAVWTGIGAAGAVVFGIALFNESSSPFRILCIALIITGVIGLRMTTE